MSSTGLAGRLAGLMRAWSLLNVEQRVAAIAAVLLVVSTFGPFSFVEAAEILTAVAVLALLKQRADGRAFHLPLGDGTVIAAAGVWCGLLIATRFLDRPFGMNVLALVCALLLTAAGLRERAKRAPDDLPALARVAAAGAHPAATPRAAAVEPPPKPARGRVRRKRSSQTEDETRQLSFDEDPTVALSDDRRRD